jgi:hypothetical protein
MGAKIVKVVGLCNFLLLIILENRGIFGEITQNLIKNYIDSMREVVEAYKKNSSGNPNSSGLVH